jgi:hypothetical protein
VTQTNLIWLERKPAAVTEIFAMDAGFAPALCSNGATDAQSQQALRAAFARGFPYAGFVYALCIALYCMFLKCACGLPLIRLGRHLAGEEAIRLLEEYALCKLKPTPYPNLNRLYFHSGDLKKAEDARERGVVTRDPYSVVYHVQCVFVNPLALGSYADCEVWWCLGTCWRQANVICPSQLLCYAT